MTPAHEREAKVQKAVATSQGKAAHCPHRACRRAKKCTRGPRGSLKRFGKPYCLVKEVAAFIARAAKAKKARRSFRREEAQERERLAAYETPFRSK
ncbi:MAG: hypothetical protein AAFP80_06145 [Pseudomonadota bacterium]